MTGGALFSSKVRRAVGGGAAVLGVLVLGALAAAWSAWREDRLMRSELLQQAALVAQTIPADRISPLGGTVADVQLPEYRELKQQLMAAVQIDSAWQGIHLLGRHADGRIFLRIDSGASDAPNPSSPGQPYEGAPPNLQRVFDTGLPVTDGPVPDRRGGGVSAFVPFADPRTGEVKTVIGIDVDADQWRSRVARVATAPIVVTASLLAMILIGMALWRWSGKVRPETARRRFRGEVVLLATAGTAVTLSAVWLTNRVEALHRRESFTTMAHLKTAPLLRAFRAVQDVEVESVARFVEASEEVTRREFWRYTEYLNRIPEVWAWGWLPAVPSEERDAFTRPERAEGDSSPALWEMSAEGQRVPASGRPVYYPLKFLEPVAADGMHCLELGFDLGSCDAVVSLLDAAAVSSLPAATGLLPCSFGSAGGARIFVVRAAHSPGREPKLKGFALAVIQPPSFLRAAMEPDVVESQVGEVDLLELHVGAPPERLASLGGHTPPHALTAPLTAPWVLTRPILAFGKTYALVVRPTEGFAARVPWVLPALVLLAGLLITAAGTVIFNLSVSRREDMERLADKRTDELAVSLRRYDALARRNRTVTWAVDRKGRYTDVSAVVQDVLGYSPDELIRRKRYCDLHPKEDRRDFQERVEGLIARKEACYNEVHPRVSASGETVWVTTMGMPILDAEGDVLGYQGTDTDITDRRRIEEELQRLSRLQQLLMDMASGFIGLPVCAIELSITDALRELGEFVCADRAYIFRYDFGVQTCGMTHEWCREGVSPQYESLQSVPLGEMPEWVSAHRKGEPISIPDVSALPPSSAKSSFERQGIRSLLTLPLLCGTDCLGFVGFDSVGLPHVYSEGEQRLLRFFAQVLVNVRQREDAEAALRESRRQHATLLANLPGMAYRCKNDRDWTMEFVSEGCRRLTGYGAEELVGNRIVSYNEIVCPPYRDALWTAWQDAIREHRQVESEYEITTRSGEVKWVWEQGGGVYAENGRLVALEGFIADISDRKRAEAEKENLQAQLLHVQKMESIGRLAGGVAHDFNNMLQAILGYTEMALDRVPPGSPVHDDLKEIQSAARRSATLTRRLQTFARKEAAAPRALDLNAALENLSGMLRQLIGERIELVLKLGSDRAAVRMDPNQVEQVLVNLCTNARDAIESFGVITVATGDANVDPSNRDLHSGVEPGDYILLSVSDTGRGMAQGVLDHLFEPFFSTKQFGSSTGLGLATVYGIAKQNHGDVRVRSELGRGSTFTVYLPRHDGTTEPMQVDVANVTPVEGHGETILLVEDEEAILQAARRMLESMGYRVQATTSPLEALRLAERPDFSLDLLLSDVVMPQMSGPELVRRVRVCRPELRYLYMSGYTANLLAQHGVKESDLHFIQKPFSRQTLGKGVRDALDRR